VKNLRICSAHFKNFDFSKDRGSRLKPDVAPFVRVPNPPPTEDPVVEGNLEGYRSYFFKPLICKY